MDGGGHRKREVAPLSPRPRSSDPSLSPPCQKASCAVLPPIGDGPLSGWGTRLAPFPAWPRTRGLIIRRRGGHRAKVECGWNGTYCTATGMRDRSQNRLADPSIKLEELVISEPCPAVAQPRVVRSASDQRVLSVVMPEH